MYRFRILLATVLCFLFALPALAAEPNDEDFFTYYYRNPEPQNLAAAFANIDSRDAPMNSGSFLPISMFLYEAFRSNPEVAAQLAGQQDNFSLVGKYTISFAICHARLPNRNALHERLFPEPEMAKLREDLKDCVFQPLEDTPPDAPEMLDAFWGAFMASGRAVYVERIISALGDRYDREGKRYGTLTGAAAEWSLRSNARQHARVLEVCRQVSASGKLTPEGQEVLDKLIREVEAP